MSERKRNDYNVNQEKFVTTWVAVHARGGTADDVATELGMPRNAVQARYSNYKKDRKDGTPGVPLPKLTRKKSTKSLDVSKLTAIVKGSETKPEVPATE